MGASGAIRDLGALAAPVGPDGQLVTAGESQRGHGAGRQLDHASGSEDEWHHAPPSQAGVGADDPLPAIQEDGVYRKAHEEGVDAVARRDPHPSPLLQRAAEHQAQATAHKRPGHLEAARQHPSRTGVDQAKAALAASRHGNAIPYRAMSDFESAGVRLHYVAAGPEDGPPIVLVHGFCSDYQLNWVGTRWQESLTGAGRRVIGLDCRGHGESEKPHDPEAYDLTTMAGDVVRLLDHLRLEKADYFGYSMGARIGLQVVVDHPERLRRAILGGIGDWRGTRRAELIARRLRGDETVKDPAAEMFYQFAAARPVNDLEALACCILGQQRPELDEARLGSIQLPVAVMAGGRDPIARSAPDLARRIPGARYVPIEGRNHMNTVPARHFKAAVLDFLAEA